MYDRYGMALVCFYCNHHTAVVQNLARRLPQRSISTHRVVSAYTPEYFERPYSKY